MAQDKRDQLYDNLIGSGRVTANEIGSREAFKNAIKDEASARTFHGNLLNSGLFDSNDIGNADDFYNSISSDFATSARPTVQAKDGYIFTEAGLDSLERGYQASGVNNGGAGANTRPTRPEAGAKSAKSAPSMQGRGPLKPKSAVELLEAMRPAAALKPELSAAEATGEWGKASDAREQANDMTQSVAQRADAVAKMKDAEAVRLANRKQYDDASFGNLYDDHVKDVFEEEKKEGLEQANAKARMYKAPTKAPAMVTPTSPMSEAMSEAFSAGVAYEKYTDPARIIGKTMARVQDDAAFTDYVFERMGIKPSVTVPEGSAEQPQLSEREEAWLRQLIAKESGEVADMIQRRMMDEYKQESAPKDVLEYIGGKALHENLIGTLTEAAIRRAAGSGGMRQQLRAMASDEFGKQAGWGWRVVGGAAPFAVDMLSGAFAIPAAVGSAVVKGGVNLAAKQVAKRAAARAVAAGVAESTAKRAAMEAGTAAAERYLATQAPILNVALRTMGSAANFSTYDVQRELARQLGDGEFSPVDILKQAAHGAIVGGAMGAVGGAIGHATANSGAVGKVLGGMAGIGAETGIFGVSSGIEKAMNDGIDIVDVDWADTLGESLGMVLGMKGTGVAGQLMTSKGREQLRNRYRKAPDYDLQLNQHNLDELKAAGYDFGNIFKASGNLGKFVDIDDGSEHQGKRRGHDYSFTFDQELYGKAIKDMNVSSDTKRKLAYLANGVILRPEPIFGADVTVGDNGKGVVTTFNAAGNIVKVEDFDSEDAAREAYERYHNEARVNTIAGLEKAYDIFDKVHKGSKDYMGYAARETERETGKSVEDAIVDGDGEVMDVYISHLATAVEDLNTEYWTRLSLDGASRDGYEKGGDDVPPSDVQDVETAFTTARERLVKASGDERVADAVDDMNAAEIAGYYRALMSNGHDDVARALLDYANAKARRDGFVSRVRDDIEGRIEASDNEIARRTGKDGMIRKAVLKDDAEVYIVDGTVAMMPDGSAVDVEASKEANGGDGFVVVLGADGEVKPVDVSEVMRVDDAIDAAEEKRVASEIIRNSVAQAAVDKMNGVVPELHEGDVYELTDGQGNKIPVQIIEPNGDGKTYHAVMDGTEYDKLDLQQLSDEFARERTKAGLEEGAEEPAADATGAAASLNPEIQTGGGIDNAGGEAGLDTTGGNEPSASTSVTPAADATGAVVTGQEEAEPAADATGTAAVDDMPMIGEGDDAEPDFMRVTPARAHSYIYNEAGLSREVADQFVEAKLKEAKAAESKVGDEPKFGDRGIGTSMAKYNRAMAEYNAKKQALADAVAYWEQVKAEEKMQSGMDVLGDEKLAQEVQQAADELRGDREALAMLADTKPRTLEELAAQMLMHRGADGTRLMFNDEEVDGTTMKGVASHTGYSRADMKGMPFLFASRAKGGLSVEEFAHQLIEMASAENQSGNASIPYDELDSNAGLNAVINLLGSVRTQGDINNYIQRNRIAEARAYHAELERQREEFEAEEKDRQKLMERGGMTDQEYDAYMSSIYESIALQAEYENSQAYFDAVEEYLATFAAQNQTIDHNDSNTENAVGRGKEKGLGQGEGQDVDQASNHGVGASGAGADSGRGALASSEEEGGIFGRVEVDDKAYDLLKEAYASGDRDAIQRAVDVVQASLAEGKDIGGDFNIEDVDYDNYDGDDPVKLAQQYIIRASHDRYLDDDEDPEYIRTGVKSPKSGQSRQNQEKSSTPEEILEEEAKVNTSPTPAQKEAGNYRKGHVRIDGFDVTIENPKGSERSGTDANGREWRQVMNNTYGYIRGTEGVDGDHIDVFLSDDPENGEVFVVDQVRPEADASGTVAFDEHKVMYGFADIESARKAYLSNYEEGWQGLGAITPVSKEEFRKWVESSHRKTKPFSEYKSVKTLGDTQVGEGAALLRQSEQPEGNASGTMATELQPIGRGDFGDIYDQFKGNPKEAIDFEKKNSALDNTTDTGETSKGGERNDTATPQNTVSEGKGSEISDTEQEKEEKVSEKDDIVLKEPASLDDSAVLENHNEAELESLKYRDGETLDEFMRRNDLRASDKDVLLYFYQKYGNRWGKIEDLMKGFREDSAATGFAVGQMVDSLEEGMNMLHLLKAIPVEGVLRFNDGVAKGFNSRTRADNGGVSESYEVYRSKDGREIAYQSLLFGDEEPSNDAKGVATEKPSENKASASLAGLSDDELLAGIESSERDSRDIMGFAAVRDVYGQAYDSRHEAEYNEAQGRYEQMLEDSNSTEEQVVEMLRTALDRWRDGGYHSNERTELRAQIDILDDWLLQKEEERREEEYAIQEEQERMEAEQAAALESARAARAAAERAKVEDLTALRLRPLEDGETCHVERVYEESKMFDFTGKENIESSADVAYIFRQLENASVENTFLVLVKDGRPTVIHLAIGDYASAPAPFGNAMVAFNAINPDKVILVHNHPSGRLVASRQDVGLLGDVEAVFGKDKVAPGIIIDTTSGKYGEFTKDGSWTAERPQEQDDAVPLKVYSFSKQVFASEWNPEAAFDATDATKIAEFISSHRLGKREKMSMLILSPSNKIVGNVLLPWKYISDANSLGWNGVAREISSYIHQMGGVSGVLYGSFDYDRSWAQKLPALVKKSGVRLLDILQFEDKGNGGFNYKSSREMGVMEPEADASGTVAVLFRDGDAEGDEENDVRFREVSDAETIDLLESQPTMKVYRSMVLIDGKLYPPMSSKEAEGKQLRQPSELGKWEESEEAPEKAVKRNGKWYFPLRKDNGKMLYAAYNPYIHTSTTMLNDQFSEAQDRDNLVVVEMEVPVSELTSEYQAEKAKDSTGAKQWKAGVIQGQLSGTREVILTRWAKPVRIVPVDEVADHIANMLAGQVEIMPTNVVTPQVREALEARGVQFVKTNNQGRIVDGENAGKTWASVYGKKREVTREREGDNAPRMTYEESLAMSRRAGYSKKQHDAWQERVRRHIRAAAERVVRKLGLDGRVTILESSDGLKGRKAKAKGWYDSKTGKIVIVLSNHGSVSDVVKTILHEGVAHYGLRELFGHHFDQFLDNVYQHGDESVRREIVELAKKHGWDFRVATEEYLARLAEDTDFERAVGSGWWSKIKNWFMEMLHKIGLGSFNGALSDNELRYVLWRSYENLAEPGRYRNPFREAEDISMQMKLGVGDFEDSRANTRSTRQEGMPQAAESVAEGGGKNSGILFRDDDGSGGGDDGGNGAGGGDVEGEGSDEKHEPRNLTERITLALLSVANKNKEDLAARSQALTQIADNLSRLRGKIVGSDKGGLRKDSLRRLSSGLGSATAAQRQYDRSTVDDIVGFALTLMDGGFIDRLSRGKLKKLLGLVGDAVGKEDVMKEATKVLDMMVEELLNRQGELWRQQLHVRDSKVNAKGVEVQGKLDIEGQRMLAAIREGSALDKEGINSRIADALDRMGSDDEVTAKNAGMEYQGLLIAKQYIDEIKASEQEEAELIHERNKAIEEQRAKKRAQKTAWSELAEGGAGDEAAAQQQQTGPMEASAFREYRESVGEAIRQNRMERIESYQRLMKTLGEGFSKSVERARAFSEAAKEHVREIQHDANSDLQGMSAAEQTQPTWMQEASNWGIVRFFMQPLATFDQMLRFFGSKSVDGRGYLFNRFKPGFINATDAEWRSTKAAHDVLDAKVQEVFGRGDTATYTNKKGKDKKLPKITRWSDLFSLERKMPGMEVTMTDAGKETTYHLTAGNLLYLYMVNKMVDGRMKLRRMGISGEDIDAIKEHLDPRLIEIADWLQDEFLVDKRKDYNEVHERMFGAPMAAIENYFPLKINNRSRGQVIDVNDESYLSDDNVGTTITGSIIKRTKNGLPLDIHADAFDVVLEHIQNMEHWRAFGEFNRDLGALLSYKTFRNRVLNMSSGRFGSGETLWQNFKRTACIVSGAYRPKVGRESIDTAIVNLSKGVTAAKISFRLYTAMKQLLSYPAYLSEANVLELIKSSNPVGAVKAWHWAIKELPGFARRLQSRQAGDTRLKKTDVDWSFWKNNIVKTAARIGMSANAFVDALTVAVGAKAIYETSLKRYKAMGYDDARAKEKALRDASISYNETQQSSENAYVSAMQLDRTVASTVLTVFRNSPMAYTRRTFEALDNLKRKMRKGYKEEAVEFMAKQLYRDLMKGKPAGEAAGTTAGTEEVIDEKTMDKARKAAEKMYDRSWFKDAVTVLIFGFGLPFLWNTGSYLPYLVLGDDDDEKKKEFEDAALHALAGPIEGLSGGAQLSEVYNLTRQLMMEGDKKNRANLERRIKSYDYGTLPALDDLQQTAGDLFTGDMGAWNEVVNLLIQSGIGVNPETITDGAVALYDAFNGDPRTSREFAMMLMRIAQVPQSQLDLLYVDELGMFAHDAQGRSVDELARRWANYKRMRQAPLSPFVSSEEAIEAKEQKLIKRFEEKVKDRLKDMSDDELRESYGDAASFRDKQLIGDQVARNAGIEKDSYGHANSFWGREYAIRRTFEDLWDDATILKAKKEAAAAGDEQRVKDIERGRSELRDIAKDLGAGFDDDAVMQEIRTARKQLMKDLDIK